MIRMRWRSLALLIGVVIVGGVFGWHIARPAPAASASDNTANPTVPVTTARAQVRDVPLYLYGLGTVQAFNVVEIKAQVNGVLTAIPVHEGQEVHKGDIVAEIDPRPYKAALDQAVAQRAEDVAQLQSAQLDLQRYEDLAKRSFAPVQQVDDQRATVNKETAAVAADTAAIETAQINLDFCTIRAPIDGRISLYQTDAGNLIEVASQTGIISITQDKPIAVVFTLPEADLPQIQAAHQQGALQVTAFNGQDDTDALAGGTLLTPNNTINTSTGTISLKASFDNQNDRLWPGQFVSTRIQVGTLHNVVIVPALAVQHGPDGLYAFVVQPDNTVRQVNITVAHQDDGMAVVSQGLPANATVVVSGQSRLSPGIKVAATSAPTTDHPTATAGPSPAANADHSAAPG